MKKHNINNNNNKNKENKGSLTTILPLSTILHRQG